MYAIAKVFILFPSKMTQFADKVIMRLISYFFLIIEKVIENFFKYFNGPILYLVITPSLLVLIKNLYLNLNDPE